MINNAPQCQAKNPLTCRDPRCPEKRFNLKYTLENIAHAKNEIDSLIKSKEYYGEKRHMADFAYQSALDWHNELLADSMLTSEAASDWCASLEIKLGNLLNKISLASPEEKEELNKDLEDLNKEIKEAELNYRATYAGFNKIKLELESIAKTYGKKHPKYEELKTTLNEAEALHAKQIIAMYLTDRKRKESDMPISVGNAIDLGVLDSNEKKEYAEWLQTVRFAGKDVTNHDLIMKQDFVSIALAPSPEPNKSLFDWRIKPRSNHKGWRIPDYVAKALYVMPDATDRIENIKYEYNTVLDVLKKDKTLRVKTSKESQRLLELKYNIDVIKKFIKN
jgi:DNA gyrase/topoisomerase IV subunit A